MLPFKQMFSMIDRARHSVLVVDDNTATRSATVRSLRAAGFNIVEAAGGAKALALAEFVSAVVLDVHLPDLFGFEVCRLLRKQASTADLPVVCVASRYVSEADQRQGMATGANAYMVAPVDPEALLATLDHLIGNSPALTH
jgi:CheY-like chemotaxis protein